MAFLRAPIQAMKGTAPGRGSPDPMSLRDKRWEVWFRRGTGKWRSEGEANYEALVMRAKHYIAGLEKEGKAGQATVRRIGDFPSHTDEGEYKTRTWEQAMLDDSRAH